MGKRIVKTPLPQRDTDFVKMDSFHYLADQHGLRIMSFQEIQGVGWTVDYLNPSLAREPKLEDCRDAQDYDLMIAGWIRACTVRSKPYAQFQSMVMGEIDRLKSLPL
jgi:hypothetical protein